MRERLRAMPTCDTCGNSYDKTFTVSNETVTGVFDSFECAAHSMAPRCHKCGVTILGHGAESDGKIYCCAHCARAGGAPGVVDRV